MDFRRPLSFEMWKSMNEIIRKYDEKLEKFRKCRRRALAEKERLIRAGRLDLHEVNETIRMVERLISETIEKQNVCRAMHGRRHELHIELYKLAYRLLEERNRPQPVAHLLARQWSINELFALKANDRTFVVVKHIAFYCMKKNNYISRNPYENIYRFFSEIWSPIKGLGEGILVMGYEHRDCFRNYIEQYCPHTSILTLKFAQFMVKALADIFREFYVHDSQHLSFLILVAFTMEVIYYIRECSTILKRKFIKMAVYGLCSVLSSKGFIDNCGMEKLEWYASAVHEGHDLAPPFDPLRSPLHQSKHPATIPWDYLDHYPQTGYKSPDLPTSRSMEHLEALPAGTEACNIGEVFESSPEPEETDCPTLKLPCLK